jgi:MarR family transcriptional regulator, organic hydroperoxide resistance regulator
MDLMVTLIDEMTAIVNRRREAAPLTSGPGFWLRLGYKAIARPLAVELKQRGIAFKHYFYIRTLLEEDGISQVELSDRVGMERATVTVVLDTLEGLGIVVREPHPSDRRKTNVFLTAKGRRMKADVLDAVGATNRIALKGISAADFERFRRTLATMIANVEAYETQNDD